MAGFNDLLGLVIRWESYRWRLGYWVVIFFGGLLCMLEGTGSIGALVDFARYAGERPLFGVTEMPFVIDVLASLIVVALVIAVMAWGMNPTRGTGLIDYTPQRYVISAMIIAVAIIMALISKGQVDMTEFTPYFMVFWMATMFPTILLFDNPGNRSPRRG